MRASSSSSSSPDAASSSLRFLRVRITPTVALLAIVATCAMWSVAIVGTGTLPPPPPSAVGLANLGNERIRRKAEEARDADVRGSATAAAERDGEDGSAAVPLDRLRAAVVAKSRRVSRLEVALGERTAEVPLLKEKFAPRTPPAVALRGGHGDLEAAIVEDDAGILALDVAIARKDVAIVTLRARFVKVLCGAAGDDDAIDAKEAMDTRRRDMMAGRETESARKRAAAKETVGARKQVAAKETVGAT